MTVLMLMNFAMLLYNILAANANMDTVQHLGKILESLKALDERRKGQL